MLKSSSLVVMVISLWLGVAPCLASDNTFKLALPNHAGQLSWSAEGYKIIQSSAKPNGSEIGIRGRNAVGTTFLGFLFLVPEQAPVTSTKCRDGAMGAEKRSSPSLKIQSTSEIKAAGALPISLVGYTASKGDGKTLYVVRGFVANGDICGDLEFYSDSPIGVDSPALKNVFAGYRLDEKYTPKFGDVFLYAEMLYREQQFKAAAPMFDRALTVAESHEKDQTTMTRVITDQAGMAYGISGDIPKARSIFENAIAKDPDYPLYYYNLACADAEQNNLAAAQKHLREAFDRKANVLHGETMPNPMMDDSFTPYRNNKKFWNFLESLQTQR